MTTTRKTIRRKNPDDLITAIYTAEGWTAGDKSGHRTTSDRCATVYDVTHDEARNQFVATRKK